MEISDKELEEAVKTGRIIDVLFWDEFVYRGPVIAYNSEAFMVDRGNWYLRGIEAITTKYVVSE